MYFETRDLVVNMPQTMLVRYWDGSIREGLVLALEGGVLRVAIKDGEDAYAFRLVNDTWMSEDNEPARFEFLIPARQKLKAVDDRCMYFQACSDPSQSRWHALEVGYGNWTT